MGENRHIPSAPLFWNRGIQGNIFFDYWNKGIGMPITA